MCSRSDRTAWRADGTSGDRLAGSQRRSQHDRNAPFSRWSAIGSPKYWRSVVVLAALWNRILGIWDIVLRTWTIRPRIAGSSPLDANGLHHLAPLLGFIGDEL